MKITRRVNSVPVTGKNLAPASRSAIDQRELVAAALTPLRNAGNGLPKREPFRGTVLGEKRI